MQIPYGNVRRLTIGGDADALAQAFASAAVMPEEGGAHIGRNDFLPERVAADLRARAGPRLRDKRGRDWPDLPGSQLPQTSKTNGKAERFIHTSIREWAYGRAFQTSAERTTAMHP